MVIKIKVQENLVFRKFLNSKNWKIEKENQKVQFENINLKKYKRNRSLDWMFLLERTVSVHSY